MLSRPVSGCRTTTAPLARRWLLPVVRAVVGVVLRTLGAYEVVQSGGDLPLPVLVGVLVDQCRLLGGLAGAHHRVPKGGAGAGGRGVSGVAEVAEAETVRETGDSRARHTLHLSGGKAPQAMSWTLCSVRSDACRAIAR